MSLGLTHTWQVIFSFTLATTIMTSTLFGQGFNSFAHTAFGFVAAHFQLPLLTAVFLSYELIEYLIYEDTICVDTAEFFAGWFVGHVF
jgi:hypothetical protein